MFCISVSYKITPLEIRQKFAFSEVEKEEFLNQLKEDEEITGGVIVSTCNRSELYFTSNKEQMPSFENKLSDFKKIEKDKIKKYCLFYSGEKAVKHLFKVTCGLDSMVLGEDEIFHQVKESYLFSNHKGFSNSELNIIFQGAFNCAKLSKTTTKLSNTPVSIGTLTANKVEEYLQRKNYNKVMVMGATGKIGSIVVKDLLAKGISIIATKGRHHFNRDLFLVEDENLEWIAFEQRYRFLNQVSVIISATGSPHYTLIQDEFLENKEHNKNYLLIDLAVPYDIDKEIAVDENIVLYDIDYFKTLSKENNQIKQGEKEKAKRILEECVEDIMKKIYLRDFKEKMKENDEEWFQKMIYCLKETLDSQQFLEILQKIYEKKKGEK